MVAGPDKAEKALVLAHIQIEVSASLLAVQYMQAAGCAVPKPVPDADPGGRAQIECLAVTMSEKATKPPGTNDLPDCKLLRELMTKIRAGQR